jgi:hypothetical protein
MRFAISIPQYVADGTFNPAGFRAYLARAEMLGFDSGLLDVHFISSLPVQRLSACTAWGEKRPAQIVGAES